MVKFQIQVDENEWFDLRDAIEKKYKKAIGEALAYPKSLTKTKEYTFMVAGDLLELWWKVEKAEVI